MLPCADPPATLAIDARRLIVRAAEDLPAAVATRAAIREAQMKGQADHIRTHLACWVLNDAAQGCSRVRLFTLDSAGYTTRCGRGPQGETRLELHVHSGPYRELMSWLVSQGLRPEASQLGAFSHYVLFAQVPEEGPPEDAPPNVLVVTSTV